MMSDSPLIPRRRKEILSRVRQRQALRSQLPSGEDILEFERKIFAEDDTYIPQLLQTYAEQLGERPEKAVKLFLLEEIPDLEIPYTTPVEKHTSLPAPQRDNILKPPTFTQKEITAFDKHHNAVRLYVVQQFEEGKKSREIAEVIGITPHKLTRWYNQVKDLPAAMHLWTPLFHEEEVGEWSEQTPTATTEEPVLQPEVLPALARVVEPSPEAVRAAKRALNLAAKRTQLERDQAAVRTWILENTRPGEDVALASQLATLAFHQKGWSLSQISRALELDVSTIRRWVSRVRQAEQEELCRQREREQNLQEERRHTTRVARVQAPRPRRRLPRPVMPLSPMAKRSVGMLRELLTQAESDGHGGVCLCVASAIERERVMATLSILSVHTEFPEPRGKGFIIPLAADEATYLEKTLAQGD